MNTAAETIIDLLAIDTRDSVKRLDTNLRRVVDCIEGLSDETILALTRPTSRPSMVDEVEGLRCDLLTVQGTLAVLSRTLRQRDRDAAGE